MKRLWLLAPLILLPILLFVCYLGASWFISDKTEAEIKRFVDSTRAEDRSTPLRLSLPSYQRGMFASVASTGASWIPAAVARKGAEAAAASSGSEDPEEQTELFLRHRIYHGPLALTPDGLKAGAGYVISTIDWDQIDHEFRDKLKEIYGEQEPVTVKTQLGFNGGQAVTLLLAPADYSSAELDVKFLGGEGDWDVSGNNDVKGEIDLSPLTLRWTGKDPGSLQTEASQFKLDFVQGKHARAEGNLGKIYFETTTSSAAPLSLELAASEQKSDFEAIPGSRHLMEGEGTFSVPLLTFTIGKGDEVSVTRLNDLMVQVASEMKEALFGGKVDFGFKSLEGLSHLPPQWHAVAQLAENGGLKGEIEYELPPSVADAWASFMEQWRSQKREQARSTSMSPEVKQAWADAIELTCREISNESNIESRIMLGDQPEGLWQQLRFAYRGDEPMVEKKTWKELLEVADIELELTVPYSVIDLYPALGSQLGSAVSTGAIAETPYGYKGSAGFTGGRLQLNGRPNMLVEMMVSPFLGGQVKWDEFFKLIRE